MQLGVYICVCVCVCVYNIHTYIYIYTYNCQGDKPVLDLPDIFFCLVDLQAVSIRPIKFGGSRVRATCTRFSGVSFQLRNERQ